MTSNLHYLFDRLDFWLEEVVGEVRISFLFRSWSFFISIQFSRIHTPSAPPSHIFFTRTLGTLPRRVTFTVDPDTLAECQAQNQPAPELPSPFLLAIRSASSRAAHLAGAVEQLNQILRDLEDIQVLAEDGRLSHFIALGV
ncbi:hypothetical protein C8J57DRAFT_717549 [Mycena rebaudengoi]|nr:hypothetical protein C8J57DRAFT_717549 [Mycena rebaudengoi]